MYSNYDKAKRTEINNLLCDHDFEKADSIWASYLAGDRGPKLPLAAVTKVKRKWYDQRVEERQRVSDGQGGTVRLTDIRLWTEDELLSYVRALHGTCPIIGVPIPSKMLALDR